MPVEHLTADEPGVLLIQPGNTDGQLQCDLAEQERFVHGPAGRDNAAGRSPVFPDRLVPRCGYVADGRPGSKARVLLSREDSGKPGSRSAIPSAQFRRGHELMTTREGRPGYGWRFRSECPAQMEDLCLIC
jgi:hypothetical protein